MKKSLVLAAVLALVAATSLAGQPRNVRQWDHEQGRSLSLLLDKQVFWAYHFAPDGGFPYFHPVKTGPVANSRLADPSLALTDLAPADHRWHRGIWFSWKFLNGVNYWDWAGRKNGLPDGLTKRVGEEVVKTDDNGAASIAMQLHYVHQDKLVLKEQREITIEAPRTDGSYAIDWRMTFTAPERDVVFDRTPPKKKPWGGYGGLSYRAAPSLGNHRVINSEGQEGKGGHGKPARWMDFSGTFQATDNRAGVAMFDHPDNPRHPTPWYVSTGKMGYFNPAFLFHEPYTLPAGKSFTLRYRMLVYPGERKPAALEKEYEAFKSSK